MSVADISILLNNLTERAANAAIGRSRIVNDVLREALRDRLRQPAGTPGSFLAEPLIEPVFGWQSADKTMQQLADEGLLAPSLVNALNCTQPINRDQEQPRNSFPRDRKPYRHQLEAWRALASEPPCPLVVTSGTGSGKTECFLVPILNDLARQTARGGRLVGVQALFLYPLNALIASQRERLADWTEPFGGNIRFSLYNGNTPEQVPESVCRETPWEVRDRKNLRASPPPILVTNATMLEYMLIRAADKPLLEGGKLRWIVLDEAHSYVGSQAAEMTLLLRRTLHAFGVSPHDVRIIATSATLGEDAATAERLKQFAADLSGRLSQDVVVVQGTREVPVLEAGDFEGLADYPAARDLRDRLAKGHATLRELAHSCPGEDVTNLLMHCISARNATGEAFLPVRLHLFHRAQSGLWACIDPTCCGRVGTRLDSPAWPFGALLTRDAPRCPSCDGLTLSLLLCDECGAPFLEAGGDKVSRVARYREPPKLDEFAVEAEAEDVQDDDDESNNYADTNRVLLAPPGLPQSATLRIDPINGEIPNVPREGLVRLGRHEPIVGCPCCGAGNAKDRLFRPLRLGGPFMTGIAADTLLDAAPPAAKDPELKPHGGRQMITFTDSRQGTARFAASWQLEAERTYVRSVLFHAVQDASSGTAAKGDELDQSVAELEQAIAHSPGVAHLLRTQIDKLRAERQALPPGRLAWRDAMPLLASRNDQQFGLRDLWAERDPSLRANDRLASLQLYAEFLRRPTRGNNLETLGLVGLQFEGIDTIRDAPALFLERGANVQDWRDFLAICITHVLRANRACFIEDTLRNWVGQRARPRSYVGHDFQGPLRGTDLRWPMIKRGSEPRARLVRLLVTALSLDINDADTCRALNDTLQDAYRTLHDKVGSRAAEDGRLQLDLTKAWLVRLKQAWICPVTRRLLDRTLRGFTPYLPPRHDARMRAIQVELPMLPHPWLRVDGARLALDHWLRADTLVEARRREGVWTDLHDRIARLPTFIRVAEHSAQQPPSRLKRYEDEFKAGRLNALACSTTMEMGVDIGGITTVAMTNVPPAPANYRQRVGRAGRRGEALAIGFTYCADDPLGWNAFDRPAQPLDQSIQPPRVALDSRLIVQRHVNALLLAGFLADPAWRPSQDSTRLASEWFFGAKDDPSPPWQRFVAWLKQRRDDMASLKALALLVAGSGLANMPDLADRSADEIECLAIAWLAERNLLVQDRDSVGGAANTAIKMQLGRMEKEFLLKELTGSGFLPGHGFPTGIIPFVVISPADKLREATPQRRDDGNGRFREFPARGIEMAIREYAPGSDIVLDGLVYRSAGITLNWQRPVTEEAAQEIQSIQHFWSCPCGAGGAARRLPEQCPACDRADPQHEKVLIPAGFAADLNEQPSGDIENTSFVPMVEPGVFVGDAQWVALANAEAGRMRASASGMILGVSRGANGRGYALCMACGRAEPDTEGGSNPLAVHRPLRNSRSTLRCEGASNNFTIQRQIRLGYHRSTNVCEFQFTHITSRDSAITAAVALREALVRQLGIERGEVGWAVHARPMADGTNGWSMFLFDTAAGGAGYASVVPLQLPSMLDQALDILACRNPDCDSACPSCLITRDTVQYGSLLNRGLVMSPIIELRDSVVLPVDVQVFSGTQRVAVHPIRESLEQALSCVGAETLLLRLPGRADSWDFASWWGRSLVERQAREGRRIVLLADTPALAAMPQDAAMALFGLITRGDGRVSICASPPGLLPASLIAAVQSGLHSVAWAAQNLVEACVTPVPPQAVVMTDSWTWPTRLVPFDIQSLLLKRPATSARLAVVHQLDGAITEFGDRFWQLLAKPPSPFLAWIKAHPRLQCVEYDDRYLFSPLTVALLGSTLTSLARLLKRKLPVRIRTQNQRSGGSIYGAPYHLHHDWSQAATRDAVLSEFLVRDCDVTLETAASRDLPHARMLRLVAETGERLEILLDQGFGYWRSSPSCPFDFTQLSRNQATALRQSNGKVVSCSEHPTWVIVDIT